MDQISHKLHDAAVCVSMVQRGGGDRTLDDVNDDAATEQSHWTPLHKPEGQKEKLLTGRFKHFE